MLSEILNTSKMNQLIPYLNFNGNCREAMTFYQSCLGGELSMQTISESPVAPQCPGAIQEHIVHSTLIKENFYLMASDMPYPDGYLHGNNFSLHVNCRSEDEINTIFNKMAAGGKIILPVRQEFWGALFGTFADKFGIRWQFHYDKNEIN